MALIEEMRKLLEGFRSTPTVEPAQTRSQAYFAKKPVSAGAKIPMALKFLADDLRKSAIAHGTFVGDRKVFLGTIPGINLKDAGDREDLLALLRSGAAQFARADLVQAMDPELVAASEWSPAHGVTYHFLVVK